MVANQIVYHVHMVEPYESQSKLGISILCIIVIDRILGHLVASVPSLDPAKLHKSSSESTHRPFQKSMVLASFETRSCLKPRHLLNPRQAKMFHRSTRENLPTPPTADNREKTVVREWHLLQGSCSGRPQPAPAVKVLLCSAPFPTCRRRVSRADLPFKSTQIDPNRRRCWRAEATLSYIEIPT